jgi:hypothetical protein
MDEADLYALEEWRILDHGFSEGKSDPVVLMDAANAQAPVGWGRG